MGSTSAGNSGIISGVFNFVSREFESFITNATGSVRPLLVLLFRPFNSRVLGTVNIPSTFGLFYRLRLLEGGPSSQEILPQI